MLALLFIKMAHQTRYVVIWISSFSMRVSSISFTSRKTRSRSLLLSVSLSINSLSSNPRCYKSDKETSNLAHQGIDRSVSCRISCKPQWWRWDVHACSTRWLERLPRLLSANTRRSTNHGFLLVQRRRRWANINPKLFQHLVCWAATGKITAAPCSNHQTFARCCFQVWPAS